MTLIKTKAAKGLLSSFSPERTKLRSLLKKASRGNVHAFTEAAASYTNLISEYLYICGVVEPQQRIIEIQKVLADCWKYLPYTRRVSDFERFLQVQLERLNLERNHLFKAPHSALCELNHDERFLLAASVFESWSSKSVRLSFRWNKRDLSKALTELKCKLSGFRLNLLKSYEIVQVIRVNDLLEGQFSDKNARKIEKELSEQYHAHQFKADWLSYRCELADIRLKMTLSMEEQRQIVEEVPPRLKQQKMEKPRFSDNIINQISFVRLPSR